MTEFTLDTSGFVAAWSWRGLKTTYWLDLSPFEQEYTTQAFRTLWARWLELHAKTGRDPATLRLPAFSDLAAETLVAIRKDCAEIQAKYPVWAHREGAGADCWRERQRGEWIVFGFPPVTPILRDGGKVYFQ
jgi:hypothetical protein